MKIFNIRFLSISLISIILIIFFLFLVSHTKYDDNIIIQNRESIVGDYSITALPLPDTLTFAGESVPLDKYYMRESYDRELLVNTYWQSNTLLLLKRANRYFPVIEPILKEQGVPDDFKYLAVIESGLMERIVSPAGAVGIWQFLSGTAKDYGLEVNKEVDERYHLEKSTVAACKFLKRSFEIYDSWAMAAASYNAGVRGMNRQIEIQDNDNYYELLLNEETARYVYRALALKEIMTQPEKYGFKLSPEDYYYPVKTFDVIISGKVENFADFAGEYNVTYRELKDQNPWLRETFLENRNKKEYTIKIPIFQ